LSYLVTNAPHPPSSSTQATSTAANTATTDESETPVLSGSQNEKDFLRVTEVTPEIPKKNRGLLHVPSRSSSQNIQPSPTSTGLSGATASDPRDSLGGRSKESKGSFLGRRRNGSATSSKMSITPPGPTAGPTGNTNPATANSTTLKRPKKSFLSFLCCGVPDHGNTLDANETATPANKVTKIPGGRPTTASRPENNEAGQQGSAVAQPETEKDALRQDEAEKERKDVMATDPGNVQSGTTLSSGANGDVNRPSGDARDQPLPELPKAESSTAQQGRSNQSVVVQSPSRPDSTGAVTQGSQDQKDGEGDVRMEDPEPLPNENEETPAPVSWKDETSNKVPPIPPVPQPEPREEVVAPEPAEQKWLLPPIAPRFQGKKCLVLDLDETLVHSSFKVFSPCTLKSLPLTSSRFYTKPTSQSLSRLRGNITMCM
jgi:RNA polymerase II subunit A small phosphatase-like protein